MGEVIATTQIPREAGWLYYCATDDKGNITICKAEMAHRGKSKKNWKEGKLKCLEKIRRRKR